MPNAIPLAQVMGPVYLLIGLSILLYVKSWKHLLEKWETDHFGLFTIMFMYAILGAICINAYNVWEWNVWLIVTLTGWIVAVKSVFYFLMPGPIIKKWLVLKRNTTLLVLSGLICAVVGVVLTYYSYFV